MNDKTMASSAPLRGIAFFNEGRYFDAHEVWEDWWRESVPPDKRIVQGLVQVAVAMHHASTGNWEGARSVMERAYGNLLEAPEEFHGIDIRQLRADIETTRECWRSERLAERFLIYRK